MSETVQSIYRRTAIPKAYWFALGLTLITSTLNPYGFKHLFYPFEVFSLVAVSRIQEWAPLNLTSSQATLFMALACFLALLYTTRRRLPDITETLIPVVFIIAALSSRRHLPLAMLTLIPFCLYAYADRVHAMVNGHLHRYMSTSPNSIPIAWRIVFAFSFSAFTISALVYSYSGVQTTHRQTIESALPVKLVDYIQENNIRGRVFNTYRYGGYLIYRLYPEQEVFIDGRADLYGDKIFLDYLTIYHAQDGWEKLFHNYKIDYVICEKGAPIRKALLESGDFVEEMTDSMNALLTRKIPLNQADI